MAQTSPYPKSLRIRWYRLVDKCHRTVEKVCALYDIPKKTYYKWWKRDFGVADNKQKAKLVDKKTKLTPTLKEYIRAKKAKTNYGPEKMRLAILQDFNITVSTTIIYRFKKAVTVFMLCLVSKIVK